MKISVLCASRSNHSNMRTVIGALDMLKSGKHEIRYVVACDWDDGATQSAAERMYQEAIPALSHCKKQNSFLGAVWNEAADSAPADVYVIVTDRALCVTPFWDTFIADAVSKDAKRVTWWTTNAGPVIPIVPEVWRQAAGQIYTSYFPFWFDDTWLHEISAMVHGLPNYMVQAACFIVKKSPMTKRMRDLRFWMDFFIAKRPERVAHAARIREKLGLPAPDMKPIEEWFSQNDAMWARDGEKWQEVMGDKSEPDDIYFEAKKYAVENWEPK